MNTKRNILKHGIVFLAALVLPLGATALAKPLKVFILAGQDAAGVRDGKKMEMEIFRGALVGAWRCCLLLPIFLLSIFSASVSAADLLVLMHESG